MSSVKVAVRVRPFNNRENCHDCKPIISMSGKTTRKFIFISSSWFLFPCFQFELQSVIYLITHWSSDKILDKLVQFIILQVGIHWVFSCNQAALQMVISVRLSVCLSVTPFWLCSHHRIIMKFSGVITNGQSKVHAKGQGQRSKVKVTEVTTELNRFRTVTPVWIHIWWWNDAYSFMLLWRGALLFLKVIRQISRSPTLKMPNLTQIGRFRTVTPVWIHQWLQNDAQSLK